MAIVDIEREEKRYGNVEQEREGRRGAEGEK